MIGRDFAVRKHRQHIGGGAGYRRRNQAHPSKAQEGPTWALTWRYGRLTSPSLMARTAAWVRPSTPSLRKMWPL